jgi:hypothetical protein
VRGGSVSSVPPCVPTATLRGGAFGELEGDELEGDELQGDGLEEDQPEEDQSC